MPYKFQNYRYALFHLPTGGELLIQRKYADRTEVSRSWQECARAYPDRHVVLLSRLSKKRTGLVLCRIVCTDRLIVIR